MQIHYAFNPTTMEWLRSSECISPDGVREMIERMELKGWIVTSCSMPDHLYQQYKNIMDNHNQNVATNHMLEAGLAPTPQRVRKFTEKSKLPEQDEGKNSRYTIPEEIREGYKKELAAKLIQVESARKLVEEAEADTTGRVNVNEYKDMLQTVELRINYLKAAIEDTGKPRKKKQPEAEPKPASEAYQYLQ